MTDSLAQRVIDSFGLTKDQRISALERGRNVIVTAGAGSGIMQFTCLGGRSHFHR